MRVISIAEKAAVGRIHKTVELELVMIVSSWKRRNIASKRTLTNLTTGEKEDDKVCRSLCNFVTNNAKYSLCSLVTCLRVKHPLSPGQRKPS